MQLSRIFHYAFCNLFLLLFILLTPYSASAADVDLEKDLQDRFEESKNLEETISAKLKAGNSASADVAKLKAAAQDISASNLLMQERLTQREAKVKGLGPKAIERQRAVSEGYSKTLTEYLALISSIPSSGKISKSTADKLKSLLDSIAAKKKRPLLGSLPYRNLNYPAKEPTTSPTITPAYRGGYDGSSADDLKSTPEAPVSAVTASLAQSLNWSPVLIYEYVKNNIETEWYWGGMKGAEETLRQKSGNDCDQAALLVALLRASGYPAKYVRGVIEFFPDIERAKNLTGIDDPQTIAELFQKAGVPFKTVLDGSSIKNIQIEHVWVETYVPYSNYRGAIADDQGKVWLGLDTSIKASGYTYTTAPDIASEYSLTGLRDDYLGATRTETPLEYLKAMINSYLLESHPSTTYSDYLITKALVPEVMQILPASMQFIQTRITNEYIEIPAELKHTATFIDADASGKELFNTTLDVMALSNQPITISYEPESVEDQEIIDSYGGLDNTPSYLVKLRTVLKVNDERIVVGQDGLAAGSDHTLSIKLTSPAGVQQVDSVLITGSLVSIVLSAQKTIALSAVSDDERSAERILFEEGTNYTGRWVQAEDELSSLLRVSIARPIPSIVMVGGVAEVTYLLDTPHGYTLKGAYVDADLRSIETAAIDAARNKTFMQLAALQGSILENRIFEDDLQVQSMSTAKLLALANSGAIPVLTIDSTNINAILPTLSFDDNVKNDISDSVNQNLTIRIPQSEMTYENWAGIGYIKENTTTGESGWMLTGSIAGGMTAWSFDRWSTYYADRLTHPYSEPAVYDPASMYFIDKVTATDMQTATAGSELPQTLQVLVHKDTMQPVRDVPVTFTIKAGGGSFVDLSSSITVMTNAAGIAKASLILGQRTDANPAEMLVEGDIFNTQVGENVIDASLASGTKIAVPFTEYGLPGAAASMNKVHGDNVTSSILSSSGFIAVTIQDTYGNPISNTTVTFEVLSAVQNDSCVINDTHTAQLASLDNPCIANGATQGDCRNLSSRMTVTSSIDGAAVHVLLGGIPNATYPISAVSETLSGQTFTHKTFAFGTCGELDEPVLGFTILPIEWFSSNGTNIMAGKSGTSIPVAAKIYFLKEGEAIKDEVLSCGDGPHTCPKIVGSRTYTTENPRPEGSTVTFNGQAGANDGTGKFTYDYLLTSGVNTINIDATGSLSVYRTYNTCAACMPIDTIFTPEVSISRTMQVYGVDISTPIVMPIMVDLSGYSLADTVIHYTISPAEYTALSAEVDIYKNGTLINTIITENQGSGTATISRGFQFDVNSTYEAEVVLNYGTSFEMRSWKANISVVIQGVEITTPPSNPNPSDDTFSTNYSFLSMMGTGLTEITTINAQAVLNPSGDTSQIMWNTTAAFGGITNETPVDRKGPAYSYDLSPPVHKTYITGRPSGDCTNHANGSCERSYPLSYEMTAAYQGVTHQHTIKQDQIDIIRQEYLNHSILLQAEYDIPVPDRNDFAIPYDTAHFTIADIRGQSAYSVVLGTPGEFAEIVRDAYNRLINDDVQEIQVDTTGLDPLHIVVSPGGNIQTIGPILDTTPCDGAPNPTTCDDEYGEIVENGINKTVIIAGANGIAETRANNQLTNYGLHINSGWRNPERNEAVGGVPDSAHQYGNALDINHLNNVSGKTKDQLYCILQTAADSIAGVNGFAEHFGSQRVCNVSDVTHVHVQQ